ncbi:MAG: PilZ domain-containing protein [Deltaproteobacteria bacterium]|nr:PilZ domain-containing protein [Deltaproteobacteria bacterium]
MNDKRVFERFELKVPARVEVEGGPGQGEEISLLTSNICAGGAFFHTKDPIPEGTKVQLEFVLSIDKLKEILDSECRIKVEGKVVRTEEAGIAVRFDDDYEIEPVKVQMH